MMRRYHARHWESGPDGTIKIAVPINGAGSQIEWRTVTDGMLTAAKGFIETGVPPTQGELDLPAEPHEARRGGFRLKNPLRKWLRSA